MNRIFELLRILRDLYDASSLKLFARVFPVIAAGLVSLPAHAALTCEVSNINKTLNAGFMSVPQAASTGATVTTLAADPFQPNCYFSNGSTSTLATLYIDLSTTAALAPGFTDVYQTNIAGLGIRYAFNSTSCAANNVTLPNGLVRLTCPFSGAINVTLYADVSVTSSLIVTGPMGAGASTLSVVPTVGITYATSESGSRWGKGPLYTGSATGTLIKATCSVTQPAVSVLLPTADTRAFSAGVGAVAAPQGFSLSFSCTTGAKVLMTLTDNVNPANRTSTLGLTTDSTAKGIGVQILNSAGTPISFGADSATPGNANQWLIGNSPNGALVVPFTARYISTGAVSPGTVKALATFTMSYQ
jgi:type 1 fimbria pilin